MRARCPRSGTYAVLVLVVLAWVVCVGGGCQREEESTVPRLSPEEYGALPGLKETANPKLRDELARLQEEQATPELLVRREKIEDNQNAAAGLEDLFRSDELPMLLGSADKFFPAGKFEFNVLNLRKLLQWAKKHEDRRLRAREALGRPQCDFGLRHDQGLMASRKFIDVVRMCGRLEAFAAAEQLFLSENPSAAIESLRCQLRLAECLGAEKSIETRLEAARIREETLRVLQAIASHPRLRHPQLDVLRDMIRGALARWPPDADAWIGDRAMGLYVYEVVRDGNLLLVLTPEEITRFGKDGSLEQLAEAARDTVEPDELYYLGAMRELIGRCGKPYAARAELAQMIHKELDAKRNSPDYPLVADQLLLANLDNALRLQARDRALVEAWSLALDVATDQKSPYQVNPMTGRKYRLERDNDQVAVWLDDQAPKSSPPDVVVPLPAS